MADKNMINRISKRLNITDTNTIKKCEEFLRILQYKSTLKLSDQLKTVICFDIAAKYTGSTFDKEAALALCSLRKSNYENDLHNISKILSLDKPISISELCVRFGCTQLKDDAENLYLNYKKRDLKIKDNSHPQYAAAAVYTVCKLNKMKQTKSEFTSISRLKPSQWNVLTNEFETFAKSLSIDEKKPKMRGKEDSEDIIDEEKMDDSKNQPQIEYYEVWKKRILEEAYQAIAEGKD